MTNVLIEFANSLGDRWAAWMVAASLDAAALLALVGLLWLAIRDRVAPQVGYYLFLLVPLKLLVPVGVTVPAAIAKWTPSALASSWLAGAQGSVSIQNYPRIETQNTAVRTDQPAPINPMLASSAQPQSIVADTHHLNRANEPQSPREIASTTSAVAHRVADAPRLSVPATAMFAWLAVVLLLLGRLARMQWRFRARLKHLTAIDESRLAVDLRDLCRRAGVAQTIRILESDDNAAPAVWGIVRPTIILPRGITSSLTAQQFRWVLLHELAHIRRRDLLVVLLQRCAALLHFFNPAVWIVNRLINRLREYACDDLAVALADGSAVESGEAFLQILRHAQHSPRGLDGALGVFGLDSRASCMLRVRRLLDSERSIRIQPGAWSLCGLVLLAVVSLPHLRAGGDAAEADPPPPTTQAAAPDPQKAKADADDAVAVDEFELRVVGPDRKPVPETRVEIRTNPMPTAEQIRQGTFVKKSTYGAMVTTDAQGRLVVKLPRPPSQFNVKIETPGYGAYWAGWSSETHAQPVPARFTAELEAGWSVGGIIVDSEGNPIEGVKVNPSIEYKKRPGDLSQLGVGTNLKTDAAGKWRYNCVPASKSEVGVEINHPSFKPDRRRLTRSDFGIERGQEPAGVVVLDRGLTVTGKVTDEAGSPIAGALVRTKFLNDIREAKTGDDGVYRLAGCEPKTARLVVSAKGRATDMKEVRIDAEMEPVDFQMQPGGKVRIRVLDEHDKPIAKARIFFQRWRGDRFSYFEFGHVNQYANEQGIWEWNEAPLDEFQADICRPDGMYLAYQPLIARDEEYVFRPPPALVVSGKIIDAGTRQPVKKFQVIPGIRSSETHMNWVRSQEHTATDGKYNVRQTSDYFAHLIRIEASGYLAAVSRDIKSNEGKITIDFELQRGIDVAATVLTPDGRPAARAKVALGVAGSQINVHNGDIEPSPLCARQDTNETGQFRFPPQDTAFQLVVTHPAGYAHVHAAPESMSATIKLEAWARVEGTYRVGKNPVGKAPITINTSGLHSYGRDVASIFAHHDVTTAADGRFVFERVVPGRARIGRRIMLTVSDGAADVTSSCMLAANFPSGETTRIDLGGTGRPAVGRLQPRAGFDGTVDWRFALVTVESNLPWPPSPGDPPVPADVEANPVKKEAWLQQWQQTPAGRAWAAWKAAVEGIRQLREASPRFTASVSRDGAFRIDDMPSGSYSLSVEFSRDAAGQLRFYCFAIPPFEGNRSDQPFDLGFLTLE